MGGDEAVCLGVFGVNTDLGTWGSKCLLDLREEWHTITRSCPWQLWDQALALLVLALTGGMHRSMGRLLLCPCRRSHLPCPRVLCQSAWGT